MKKYASFIKISFIVFTLITLIAITQPAMAYQDIGHVVAPVVVPVIEPGEWARFGDFYGKTGNAGYGWIDFSTNNVVPASATLTINGVGTFEVTNIVCEGAAKKTCTGMISGLPIGGTPSLHGGTLHITTTDNEHINVSGSQLQVPPAP